MKRIFFWIIFITPHIGNIFHIASIQIANMFITVILLLHPPPSSLLHPPSSLLPPPSIMFNTGFSNQLRSLSNIITSDQIQLDNVHVVHDVHVVHVVHDVLCCSMSMLSMMFYVVHVVHVVHDVLNSREHKT